MDISLLLEHLVPAAIYGGSLNPRNTDTVYKKDDEGNLVVDKDDNLIVLKEPRPMTEQEIYDTLRWDDPRPKPTWEELMNAVKDFEAKQLVAFKISSAAIVDALAETERERYVTTGVGMAMVYQRKVQEAETLEVDPSSDPDPENYPLLAAEIGLTADTLKTVAETILSIRDHWIAIASQIEVVRLTAKKEIKEAKSEEEVRQILSDITWPEVV